jgi:3-hydroxyisobutyrate dehydrogenase
LKSVAPDLKHILLEKIMIKAGVIGLGQIGGGIAQCLARSASLAGAYDVRPEASAGLEGVGPCATSPMQLARQSDAVIIAVVNAQQVHDVLSGPQGVLAGAGPGFMIIIQSTLSMADLSAITSLVGDRATVIDCGVTGGDKAAANKGLVSLVGAQPEVFERIYPLLDQCSGRVLHMGGPGAGMAAKIARNTLVYNIWRAAYEATCLARAAGVDIGKLAEAVDFSAAGVGSPMLWMNRAAPADVDEQELGIRRHVAGLLDKDLSAALELAADLDVQLPMATLSLQSARKLVQLEN